MAYTPINWQTGDTITAAKLNKMDNGWSVDSTQLFSETVTTTTSDDMVFGALQYAGTEPPGSLNILFNGANFTYEKQENQYLTWYGADSPDSLSSDYPFMLSYENGEWLLYTQTAGTYTISASTESIQISDDFKAAVKAIYTQL